MTEAPDPARSSASMLVQGTVMLTFLPAAVLTLAVLLVEVAPYQTARILRPENVGTVSSIAGVLALAGVLVASVDRLRREPRRGLRGWLLCIVVATLATAAVQAVAFLAVPDLAFTLGSLSIIITSPVVAVCLMVLMWPTDFQASQRNTAMVDAAVGVLGLLVIWAFLVIPNLPVEDSPWQTALGVLASVAQLGLLMTVLVLAAAAHRRSQLPVKQLILFQLAVLIYIGGDVAGPLLADRVTATDKIQLVAVVVAGAFLAAALLRPARERETASQLWLRDVWSTVVPLSPVALAAAGLLLAMATDQSVSPAAGAAIAIILMGLILALIWVRTIAASAVRRATVSAAVTNLNQAADQAWFRSLTQHSREMVIVLDQRSRIVYASETFLHLLGATSSALRGRDLSDILPGIDADAARDALLRSDESDNVPIDVTVTDGSGSARDLQFMVASLRGVGTDGYVLTGTDVTDSRRMRVLLGESRRRDRLTGLLNKTAFLESVEEVRNWALPQSISILVVDLYQFRRFNDVHGQEVGDSILRGVAEVLDRLPGPILAVARIGDNEFALLLRDRRPHVAAEATARLVQKSLTPLTLQSGDAVWVRAAVGYSTPQSGSDGAASMVEAADLAAGRSKADPGLGLVSYEPSMRAALLDELKLTEELRAALDQGDFVPHYQPIVDLTTGSVAGVEALVRRRLTDGRWQGPDDFIPLAERVGLVASIDRALRAAALADLKVLLATWPEMKMSLNVSALEFSGELVDDISAQMALAGVDPRSVTIEVTESAVADSEALGRAIISGLHDLGCRVALDDFGTGHSSLAGLGSMNVDLLKIDQTFVRDLVSSPRAVALLRGVVELGRGLGLKMVAEGITSVEQADLLRGMGCDLGQGFLYTHALPMDDLVEWMRPSSAAGGLDLRSR